MTTQPLPQVGDFVEVTHPDEPRFSLRAHVWAAVGDWFSLQLGTEGAATPAFSASDGYRWKVVRSSRPLFSNSDRDDPFPGDVVEFLGLPWTYDGERWTSPGRESRETDPQRRFPMRLLVDGTTGQVVP